MEIMPENIPGFVKGSPNNINTATSVGQARSSSEFDKAKQNKLLIVVAVLAVLSLVSIGGMVWSLVQTRAKDEKIDSLTARLVENDIKVDEEMNTEVSQPNDSNESSQGALSKPTESMSTELYRSGSGPYIEDGYFYVPEWGVKYRLTNELTDYGYAVAQDSLSNAYGKYEIGMTAVDKNDLMPNPQARYYDDIFSCSAVMVTRTDNDLSNLYGPKKIVRVGGAQYVIYDYTANDGCDVEDKVNKVVDRLVEIFSNPESI